MTKTNIGRKTYFLTYKFDIYRIEFKSHILLIIFILIYTQKITLAQTLYNKMINLFQYNVQIKHRLIEISLSCLSKSNGKSSFICSTHVNTYTFVQFFDSKAKLFIIPWLTENFFIKTVLIKECIQLWVITTKIYPN